MDKFIHRNKHYLLSITWLLLIILFTYTTLVDLGLKVDSNFIDEYCNHQHCAISMLVNYGLLSMVIFDYIGAGKRPTVLLWVLSLVAGLCVFAIFTHTGAYITNELAQYVSPFNDYKLSYWFHCIFFMILLYIKIKSMEETETEAMVIQERY